VKIEFGTLHSQFRTRYWDGTEKTYLLVTVMAMFAKQYEAMLATAWVEADDIANLGSSCCFDSEMMMSLLLF
jgi:hypothetical protein